jgi:hypothetical protein
MQENQTLRGLLRSLAGFIGDGAGGLLPKLGWEMSDFNNFLNRSETDTAFEGYQRRKKTDIGTASGQKRSFEEDVNGRNKKARASTGDNAYSMMLPMNQSNVSGNSLYPTPRAEGSLFSDPLKANGTAVFGSPTTGTPPFLGSAAPGYHPLYVPPVDPPSLPSTNISSGSPAQPSPHQRQSSSSQLSPEQFEDDDDPNKTEAYKLIQ